MTKSYTIIAMYKFVDLSDFRSWQQPLKAVCLQHHIKGTILLASEGINGTIAGSEEGIQALLSFLQSDVRFQELDYKVSYSDEMPFFRMKVRLKKEIVALGQDHVDPSRQVGHYVDPQEWNALIQDPETIIIDTRNDYEIAIGKFKNAVNPMTQSFRELPEYVKNHLDPKKHKKVAMYCTGGIRCEKSTSYLKAEGFENVYHLKGGILKYLETIPQDQSLWEGECFVFDQRVAVTHGLHVGDFTQCHGCRHPLAPEDLRSPDYKAGVSCPYCFEDMTADKEKRRSDRQLQMQLAKSRNEAHIGGYQQPKMKRPNKDQQTER